MAIAKSRAMRMVAVVVFACFFAAMAGPVRAAERILPNDNRVSAGTLAAGALTVHLEARTGEWKPDGERDPAVTVRAFAVEGGPLQIPAPLLRVREGTSVHVVVRNQLEEPLEIHGLYSRPGSAD